MTKAEEEFWNERYNQEDFQMKIYYQDIGYQATRPSTIYKPTLTIDSNMWCALYGSNLQEGVAGFGKSPSKAYEDFDKVWTRELK